MLGEKQLKPEDEPSEVVGGWKIVRIPTTWMEEEG